MRWFCLTEVRSKIFALALASAVLCGAGTCAYGSVGEKSFFADVVTKVGLSPAERFGGASTYSVLPLPGGGSLDHVLGAASVPNIHGTVGTVVAVQATALLKGYIPLFVILFTGVSCLCVALFIRNLKTRKALQEAREQVDHVQLLRRAMAAAVTMDTVEAAIAVILQAIGSYLHSPVLVVSLFDETLSKASRKLYWHFEREEDVQIRFAIQHAMTTEYMESLNVPLWVPDIAGYPTLFDSSSGISNVFGSACFVPRAEADLGLVVGCFFLREASPQEGSLNTGYLMGLFAEVCYALVQVTKRVQSESALCKQLNLHSELFEHVGFSKMLADPETGEIVYVNEAAARFFGYENSALRGMTLWQLHSSGELATKSLYRRALRTNGYVFEVRHVGSDGSVRNIEVQAAPVTIDGAMLLYLSYNDVSQRKQVEAALADSEQRLRHLVENAPMALALCDPQCNFLFVNPAYAQLFGYRREEMKGMSLKALLRDVDISEFMNFQTSFLQEGEEAVREWPMVRRDGELRTMEVRCFILAGEAGLPQVATFVQDITDRQRLEDMMIQSEKMASVGSLAAGMAHEINNPLGGILQGCQNIKRRLDPALQGNMKAADALQVSIADVLRYLEERSILRFFEGICESATRAAQITANMLDFSRRGNSEHTRVSVNELMDKAIALVASDYDLNRRYDFKQIRIVREYRKNMEPVSCGATEIEQVVLNLLKNAAQAMGEASPPIAHPTITIRTRDEGDMAVFEVEDNGPGMPKHVARRIFEPFYTTKKVGYGTGLGLAVSYYIITNNHRGSVVLDTVPARGTRFTISLPRNN